jgi:hypothetical protein
VVAAGLEEEAGADAEEDDLFDEKSLFPDAGASEALRFELTEFSYAAKDSSSS